MGKPLRLHSTKVINLKLYDNPSKSNRQGTLSNESVLTFLPAAQGMLKYQ